ncbi:unnamed protein product [Symbiodinium sp. KB8]|nr:unnamed protein product [Symbiodinium sp. KB8]
MVRGRLPASTWTGSLLVHFTQRAVVRVDLKDAMVAESMKVILKVRLHRGLYLGWYANQNVTVLVQLAGCYQEAKSTNGWPRKNANLLSFPGKVSAKGLLQFVDDTPKGGLFSSQDSLPAWVERQTSKVMNLPKDVSHAYLYIVSNGDEDLPPLAWAKFPISVHALNTAQWTPVRFDQSVVKLNGSKSYHEDMAGMLLGSVCIQTGEEEDLNSNRAVPSGRPAPTDPVESVKEVKDKPEPEIREEAPVVTRPFSLLCSAVGETQLNVGSRGKVTTALGQVETKKVYIHLDVLAARSLPSGDEDGVPDACYEVKASGRIEYRNVRCNSFGHLNPCLSCAVDRKVGDQTALLHEKDPFCSLDPVFMDRLTIGPVEAEVLKGPDGEDELDLPPIVVRVLDKDDHTISSSFEVLGRAIIYNVPLLEFDEDDVPHVGQGGKAAVSKLDAFLNKHHSAVWYALNSDLRLKFRRNAFGASADGAWARRPRLLMAAGYTEAKKTDTYIESLKKAKTKPPHWCFQQIQTERHACYKIRVDVLGLRYLEAWAGSNENVELEVVPFWKSQSKKRDNKVLRLYDSGTTRFLESSDQNPSFQTATKFDKECEDYMKKMEQLLLFQGFEKGEDVWDGGQSAKTMRTGTESRFLKAQPSSTAQEWEKFRVRKDRLLGAGFQAPVHTVPIIPYLQTELDDELGKTVEPDKPEPKEASGIDPSGKDVSQISLVFPELEDDYVLLPDVVIRLRNIDENKDEGIACLSLPYSGSKLPKEVSKMMQQALRTRDVIQKYEPDANDNQRLALTTSDKVEVIVHNKETHWVYGRKVQKGIHNGKRAKAEGWFPDWAVKPITKTDWYQHCLEDSLELQNLSESDKKYDWENTPQWGNPRSSVDLVDVFVDVFAVQSGRLRWDGLFHTGRSLLNQRLFSITPDLDNDGKVDGKEKPTDQFFNKADWMLGQPHFREECFDWRVAPALHCDLDDKMQRPTEPARNWLSDKKLESLARKTLKQAFRHNLTGTEGTVHPIDATPCIDLQKTARSQMFRSVSHLHVPEDLRPSPKEDPALKENLHTFVRKVGHRISDKKLDRSSRVLARLRVGVPQHLKKRVKEEHAELTDLDGKTLRFTLELTDNVTVKKDGKKIADVPPGQKVRYDAKAGQTTGVLKLPGKDITVRVSGEDDIRQVLGLFRTLNDAAGPDKKPKQGGHVDGHEQDSGAFLLVKFKAPGVVYWAPPEEQTIWEEPGALLFLVKVDATGEIVPVRVPSFDLRFEHETAWYPVKTLAPDNGFSKEMLNKAKPHKAKELHTEPVSNRLNPVDKKEVDDHAEPDGHSVPVFVSKNAFCCRIKQRPGLQHFDRLRTKNWFKTSLCKVFPEVENIFLAESSDYSQAHAARHFFLDRCLNIRKPMVRSEDLAETCILKGHVEVTKVEESKAQDDSDTGRWLLPVRRLWVQTDIVVRVCILTVRGLTLEQGLKLTDDSSVYAVAKVNGMSDHLQRKSHARMVLEDGSGCDFYASVEIQTSVPGVGTLQIEVKADVGTYTRQEVTLGRAVIDIEDRWLALQARDMREVTNKKWIDQNLSPSEPVLPDERKGTKARPTAGPGGKESSRDSDKIQPALAPSQLEPIETTDLFSTKKHQENRRVGSLRCWVDMGSLQRPPPQVDFRHVPQAEYEIRMLVKNVTNITQFKDFGERNDVRVVAYVKMKSQGQEPVSLKLQTDVHKYARYTASFNWQWAFRVTAPLQYCYIILSLVDEDSLTEADLMYAPKELPLEYLVMYAHEKKSEGEDLPGPVRKQVIFDAESGQRALELEPPPMFHPKCAPCERCFKRCCDRLRACCRSILRCCSCFCCCCIRREKRQVTPAYLNLQVEIVSAEEAALHEIPKDCQVSPPEDRMGTFQAVTNPLGFIYNYLGPTNYFFIRRTMIIIIFFLSVLVILACVYLILQIVLPGLEIYDRIQQTPNAN